MHAEDRSAALTPHCTPSRGDLPVAIVWLRPWSRWITSRTTSLGDDGNSLPPIFRRDFSHPLPARNWFLHLLSALWKARTTSAFVPIGLCSYPENHSVFSS